MRSFSLLPIAALCATSLAAPTPAEGVSFPITDLLDSDLTIDEYVRQLEGNSNAAPAVTKRQYTGTTYNQLTDGTPCRAVTVIYARGTTQEGNVGDVGSEGPTFLNALANRLGGTGRLAIQGVDYPANIFGFLAGGDAGGATTTLNLINRAITQCPSTKIVVSGYSQGAQLVHTATQRLSAANAARINAIVTFGDPDQDESFGPVAASKILIICHDGDNICDNGIIVTADHRNYERDAPAAAEFVAARV
ncbi:hypothetical protein LEMA_P089840.1 [Plenodomus lingam JN3]|uniref:Cutinase n=1 Tax=Leptosphaeria maculans (strain JN3 / isolate v23.1.3 / race Av1-4-5-6-7-8) TaxID=985895 RepID=E5A2E0_LEPMJ|nr:hypothetical protein LEMA_P089840.1 [Plenodomus lingam JN3]CBX97575.1 hypothetical protein LEMA_P089840.1 [Plenodomus lingam JN3]